jgi:pyrroline-5-carboxylate reductase
VLQGKRIGFLGGGNMAEALLRGLVENGIATEQLGVSDPQEERLEELRDRYSIHGLSANIALVEWADIVILAVKPQVAMGVLAEVKDSAGSVALFISVAAGLTTQSIEVAIGDTAHVVRSMPNTPALVRAGATAISPGRLADADDLSTAKAIFDAVGITEVVKESQLDAVTGLSGSGPAYAFIVLDALSDAGVKMGLPRDTALRLAAQTLFGSAKMLMDTNGHPGKLKDMVTSPGGTTIAGVHALEAGGLRTTLISAVEAATNRAKELGKGE